MMLDSQAYKVPGAARKECPDCGTSNLSTAKKCFKCGHNFDETKNQKELGGDKHE